MKLITLTALTAALIFSATIKTNAQSAQKTEIRQLYNLAKTYTNTNKLTEAKTLFETVVSKTKKKNPIHKAAKKELNKLDKAIPRLTITVKGHKTGTNIKVNGQTHAPGPISITIQVNPGQVIVNLTRQNEILDHEILTIATTENQAITLTATAPAKKKTTTNYKPHAAITAFTIAAAAAVLPIITLATSGDCDTEMPLGCQEEVRFGVLEGVLLGVSGLGLITGFTILLWPESDDKLDVKKQAFMLKYSNRF